MILDDVEVGNRLEQVARQVVRHLLQRPGFGFLEEEEFIHQTLPLVLVDQDCHQAAMAGADPTRFIERRIKNHYTSVLYMSILQGGSWEQNRAYHELSRYLYRNACGHMSRLGCPAQLTPILAEDGTQGALIRIHKYVVGKINKPGLFLYFALQNLKNECFCIAKEAQVSGSWKIYEQSDEDSRAELEDFPTPFFSDNADLLDCLIAAIQRLPNKDWQVGLLMKYFSGWDDEEIAKQALHTTKGNVQAMRTRALAALRKDGELRKCLES